MEQLKSFDDFIKESAESNTKEAELLTQKEELLAKKKTAVEAKDEKSKTFYEKEIAKIDVSLDQIRETEKAEAIKDEQV